MNQTDYFANKAKDWDAKSHRVLNAQNIAKAILKKIDFTGREHLMDFGAGTGLLSWFIADRIKKITGVDFSAAMLETFRTKNWPCEIGTIQTGTDLDIPSGLFDGIISSMTLHHIDDIPGLFKRFYDLLKPGGFVALGDLVKEDGSFHEENTGVMHLGFEKKNILTMIADAGFYDIGYEIVHEMEKITDKGIKTYPVFLLTGIRK